MKNLKVGLRSEKMLKKSSDTMSGDFLYKENPALDAGFGVAYSYGVVKTLQLG